MSRPSFVEGVAVAAAAALGGSAAFWGLALLVPQAEAARVVLAGLALAYLLYLLSRSAVRVGRVSAVVLWLAMTAALAVVDPPLGLHGLAHLGAVWLTRSLVFQTGVLGAAADLALIAGGTLIGLWAASATASVFAGLWCFWLVQALFTAVPVRAGGRRADARAEAEDAVDRAHTAAELALRRLAAR